MKENNLRYENISHKLESPTVYVIQEIPGTKMVGLKLILWALQVLVSLNFYFQNFLK